MDDGRDRIAGPLGMGGMGAVGESLEAGVTHRDGDGNLVPALPYTETQIIYFGVQLCELLEHLAGRPDPAPGADAPVIHGDIRPATIVRDPQTDRVWLVDSGPAGYAPPEQGAGRSDPRSAVYALGATLYHLLTDDDPRDQLFELGRLDRLPARLQLALRGALAADPAARRSPAEFRAALVLAVPGRPASEVEPLPYPDARSAVRLSDIPHLALGDWDHTRDLLQTGDLEHWLRRSLHNPVAADAAKRVVAAYADQDQALDAFLRELDPHFPPGRLELPAEKVDLGLVTTGRAATATVELRNTGRGYGRGTVTGSAAWLAAAGGRLGIRPGGRAQLVIEADTSQLEPGRRYAEQLTITPAGGGQPLTLEVVLTVAEPRVHLSPKRLAFDLRAGDAAPQELALSNTGANQVEFTVMRDQQWLVPNPTHLILPPGQSGRVAVTVRADRLPPLRRPQAHLTVTPDHGPAMRIPVSVLAGRPPLWRRVARVLTAGGALGRLAGRLRRRSGR